MFTSIFTLIIDTAAGLLAGMLLLRFWMQAIRVRPPNQVGQFIFQLTDWLVLPFRKLIPAMGRLDVSSLTAAWLMKLSHVLIMWALTGAQAAFLAVLLASVLGLLHWVISGLTGIVLLYAILSWVQPNSGSMMLLSRLVEPFLAPLRNALPQPGGIDLSPLVLLVLLQVVGMLLAGLQFS